MPPNEPTSPQIPPDPNTPPAEPIRRIVIQPLSSEDDIRQAAASSGAPARASEPSVNPNNVDSYGATPTEPTEYENTYEGALITEPIHRPDQPSPQYSPVQASPVTTTVNTKKPVAKIIGVIIGLLIVGALSITAWLFLSYKVSPADLVQENVGQSSYMRPKQWSPISAGASGYGDLKAKGGKSTALMSVSEMPGSSSVRASSEEEYDKLRKMLMEQLSETTLIAAISANSPMACEQDTFDVAKSEDTKKNDTTVGLIAIVMSCKKDGGTVTMKMRMIMGMNDGRARMIIVAADQMGWLMNEKAFQQMLDSVEERKA